MVDVLIYSGFTRSVFGTCKRPNDNVTSKFRPSAKPKTMCDENTCEKIGAKGKYQVALLRHGESEWNQKNLFCGWHDAKLSDKGIEEAKSAGKALKDAGYKFDVAFTSVLTRAQQTLDEVLVALGQRGLETVRSWRLNERHYGGLTGLNKAETAEKYGEEQVMKWRRGYDVPPPPIDCENQYFCDIVNDPRYEGQIKKGEFPLFESLKMTKDRTMPFWNETIVPTVKNGKRVLIVAHGNSLRSIVMQLDKMSEEAIMELNIPTGIPFVYSLNEKCEPVEGGSMQFLGDPELVKQAMEKVANQGKAKT